MDRLVCRICGAPATNGAQEIAEIEPAANKAGMCWSQWVGLGFDYGCDNHPIPYMRIYREGDKDYPVERVKAIRGLEGA